MAILNDYSKKVKLIYVPFLLIAVAFISIYTLLDWLLFIKHQVLPIRQDVLEFWLPFALPWIPVYVWLQPRLKLLSLQKKKRFDTPFFYPFAAAMLIAIPTLIAQHYVETATGNLIALGSINQIDQHQQDRYFKPKQYFVDKQHAGVYVGTDVSGRHDEYFDMYIYAALPVFETESDTSQPTCKAWLGIKYSKSISNSHTDSEKDTLYKAFAEASQQDFDNKDVQSFVYLSKVATNTDEGVGFGKALPNSPKFEAGHTLVLQAVNEPFESRNGNSLPWALGTFAAGNLLWLIMLVFPVFDAGQLHRFEIGKPLKVDKDSGTDFFIPKGNFFVTPLLIYANILVFVIMVFAGLGFVSFDAERLVHWGASYGPLVWKGQWWRLLTSTFVHGGLMHLLGNIYGLFFVGLFLEPILGRGKYLLVYLLTGIFASFASLYWHADTVSMGASGAIFGLFGVFLALLARKVYPVDLTKFFLINALVFVGINLVLGMRGNADNAAHIGGLVSGFIIGLQLSYTAFDTLKHNADKGIYGDKLAEKIEAKEKANENETTNTTE